MFTCTSRHSQKVAAAVIVMPRPSPGPSSPSWLRVVHLAKLVGATRVVQDPLRRRRLARVDVGHDPYVRIDDRDTVLACDAGGAPATSGSGKSLVRLRILWVSLSFHCQPVLLYASMSSALRRSAIERPCGLSRTRSATACPARRAAPRGSRRHLQPSRRPPGATSPRPRA